MISSFRGFFVISQMLPKTPPQMARRDTPLVPHRCPSAWHLRKTTWDMLVKTALIRKPQGWLFQMVQWFIDGIYSKSYTKLVTWMGLSQTNCNKETLLRLPVRLFAPHPDPVAAPKEILLLLVGHVPCLLLILGHGRFKFNGYNKS